MLSLTQTIPAGPAGIEYVKVDAIEGRRPMMEKAIPKTSIIVKFRRSSCLYPSFAMKQRKSPCCHAFMLYVLTENGGIIVTRQSRC